MKHDTPAHGSRPYDYHPNLRNAEAFRAGYEAISKDHWKCPGGVRNATGDVKCWHCGAERPEPMDTEKPGNESLEPPWHVLHEIPEALIDKAFEIDGAMQSLGHRSYALGPIESRGASDQLYEIRRALWDYHHALDTRQHGGIAQGDLVNAVSEVFDTHWKQGATLETPRP